MSGKQMSNNYAPCFNRIDFVVIPSYIVLPFRSAIFPNFPLISNVFTQRFIVFRLFCVTPKINF